MVTNNQLLRHPRTRKIRKPTALALKSHWNSLKKKPRPSAKPQISGVVSSVKVLSPKKPNSANRKVVRVNLSNKKVVTAYIPGENHTIQPFHSVLLAGGGAQDLPGASSLSVIRGNRDAEAVQGRKQGRSRCGTKKPKKS